MTRSATMAQPVRVMLVDDHPVVREGLRAVLAGESDIALVGEACDGKEAADLLEQLHPDVVLMDVQLPGASGIDVVRRLKAVHPEVAFVVLTVYDSELYFLEAMRAGACGYLLKDAAHDLIRLAIRAAALGGTVAHTTLLQKGLRGAAAARRQDDGACLEEPGPAALSDFTAREVEILRLLARGCNNRTMCAELHLAEVTVKKYVQAVVAKLKVRDRTSAALMAARLGLCD